MLRKNSQHIQYFSREEGSKLVWYFDFSWANVSVTIKIKSSNKFFLS